MTTTLPIGEVMKSVFLLLIIICSWSVYAADLETGEDTAEIQETGTFAVPILHDPPKYPISALRRHIEGWVVVRFSVLEDGTTADIEVVDTNVEDLFEEAAIRAASAWTYRPATRDGKPTTQYNKTARLLFIVKGQDNIVSKQFQNTYKKALLRIKDGDMATAKDLIGKLDATEKRLLAEVCYLDVLKARYFEKEGDKKKANRHVERALVIADDVVSKNIYVYLLKRSVVNNGLLNNYQKSLKRYATLLEVDRHLAADDPIHDFAKRVKQELNGQNYITSSGELADCNHCKSPVWRRRLNRNHFSIDQVVGTVNEIKIVCQSGTVLVAYDQDTVWSINKNWGECFLRVYGEAGTTLRLLEHPDPANAKQAD